MRWSNRDREMARRRMSPGAKVGIFVAVIAITGILFAVGWSFLSSLLDNPDGEEYPIELVAGEEFKPEEVVNFKGTDTTAILDGVTQKVQAQDPTEEWLAALPEAECNDDNLCTSPAPNSVAAPSTGDDGGSTGGNFFEDLLARFGITGTSVTSLVGAGIGATLLYFLITDDDK